LFAAGVLVVITWPVTAFDDWILRAGKTRLIDCDVANQINAARPDVADFNSKLRFQFVFARRAVLLDVNVRMLRSKT